MMDYSATLLVYPGSKEAKEYKDYVLQTRVSEDECLRVMGQHEIHRATMTKVYCYYCPYQAEFVTGNTDLLNDANYRETKDFPRKETKGIQAFLLDKQFKEIEERLMK